MLDLYVNIRNRRKELKMTQSELANKTGYNNKSSIATIESGKVDLPLSKINEFAKALECTPGYLMGWEDAPSAFEKIEGLSSDETALVANYRMLSPNGQEKLFERSKELLQLEGYPTDKSAKIS